MNRKGREFEQLIEKLEQMAIGPNAKISSPGYLKDRITGQNREVDILIEDKIGTSQIRVIIECRDRDAVEDVTWIEQIGSKLHDVQAHKAIAVSSNKFTSPAVKKAEFYQIETRTYQEIDLTVIRSWWQPTHLTFLSKQLKVISAAIFTDKNAASHLLGKTAESKFLKAMNGQLFSINELMANSMGCIENIDSLLVSGPQRLNVTLEIDQNDQIFIPDGDVDHRVEKIEAIVEIAFICTEIPISRVSQYEAPDRIIAQTIEFDKFPIEGNPTLQIIKGEDGALKISFRPESK